MSVISFGFGLTAGLYSLHLFLSYFPAFSVVAAFTFISLSCIFRSSNLLLTSTSLSSHAVATNAFHSLSGHLSRNFLAYVSHNFCHLTLVIDAQHHLALHPFLSIPFHLLLELLIMPALTSPFIHFRISATLPPSSRSDLSSVCLSCLLELRLHFAHYLAWAGMLVIKHEFISEHHVPHTSRHGPLAVLGSVTFFFSALPWRLCFFLPHIACFS